MGKYRSALFLVGLLIGAASCDDTVGAIDRYLDARDERVAAFCQCFGPLIDYADEDGVYSTREYEQCVEGEQLEVHQRSCITGMYTSDAEFPPDVAFDCLTAAESDYKSCLNKLSCDDTPGLESCIDRYNNKRDNCPRMSTNDEETFERCTRA